MKVFQLIKMKILNISTPQCGLTVVSPELCCSSLAHLNFGWKEIKVSDFFRVEIHAVGIVKPKALMFMDSSYILNS